MVVSLPVCTVGMLVLTVLASVPTSYYRVGVHHTVVYLGLYLAALGSGGIKPCAPAFGADLFDIADPMELAKKGSFFNCFAIPTVLMVLGLAVFVSGSRVYRFRNLGESSFISLCQVVVAAARQWRMELPDDNWLLYDLTRSSSEAESRHRIQHTNQFRFLDKVAIVLPPSDKTCTVLPTCSWRLFTVTQVEELKILLRMFPIWASFVIFYAVSGQLSSTFIEQGMVMDKRVGPFAIPPASLSIFGVFSVLIWVPIYETVSVPLARHYTGNEKGFSQTQRLGIGFAMSMLTMVYVER
ncbi:hypothetical protein ACQ4PT_014464 [Festuca glaucescens]